jgi:hypothetical protein
MLDLQQCSNDVLNTANLGMYKSRLSKVHVHVYCVQHHMCRESKLTTCPVLSQLPQYLSMCVAPVFDPAL